MRAPIFKFTVIGIQEIMKVDVDGRPLETAEDVWTRFSDRVIETLDIVLNRLGISFYTDDEVAKNNMRYCRKKDYALCSLRDGFCGVYDACARILKDGRHVHVVYQEFWDDVQPLTFVVIDVVIREPREV